MEVLIVVGFLGMIGAGVFLLAALVMRKGNKRYGLFAFGGFFVLMVVAAGISGSTSTSTPATAKPTATARPTATPIASPTPTPTFEELKAKATLVSYQDLFRSIESYKGQYVYFKGQIVQVVQVEGDWMRELAQSRSYKGDGVTTMFGGLDFWQAGSGLTRITVERNTGSDAIPAWTAQAVGVAGNRNDEAHLGGSINVLWDPAIRTLRWATAPGNLTAAFRISGDILRRKDYYTLRVNVTQGQYGLWDDDILLDYTGSRLLEKDTIEFIASVVGPYNYTTVLGAQRTVPKLSAIRTRLIQ